MAERTSLTVFTSNATRAVLDSLATAYERESGHRVTVQSDSARVILREFAAATPLTPRC